MNTKVQPTFKTERLILRPFTLSDAPRVQYLASDRRIAEMVSHIPHPYPEGAAKEWITGHRPGWQEGIQASFAIVEAHAVELYGAIGLTISTVDDDLTEAELGYWLGVDYWGKGIVTEACQRIVEFGLNDLGLHRIQARRLSINPASGRVLEKAGFVHTRTADGTCGDKYASLDYYEIRGA